MTYRIALDNLCRKYGKYGFTREFLSAQLSSGIMEQGFTVNVAYNGLRMILAQETGEKELFSVNDVAEATGESPEWVVEQIEEYRAELLAAGENPDDYFIPAESKPGKVTWYSPQGLPS